MDAVIRKAYNNVILSKMTFKRCSFMNNKNTTGISITMPLIPFPIKKSQTHRNIKLNNANRMYLSRNFLYPYILNSIKTPEKNIISGTLKGNVKYSHVKAENR